jgi:hypothetical protein
MPDAVADEPTAKTPTTFKPTRYRVTFQYNNHPFIAHAESYTRQGAIDLAAELLRGEDGFEPEHAMCVGVEVLV